jgi:hypothetical protein
MLPTRAAPQAAHLSVGQARGLLAEVIVIRDGRPEASAGTIVGYRSDTLYVVTAGHVVRGGSGYSVRPGFDWPAFPGHLVVTSADRGLDYAVLAVPASSFRLPRVARRRHVALTDGEPLFALGCPRGSCSMRPESATLLRTDGPRLELRSTFLEAGFSGGPLVDRDGALIGIITHADGISGLALDWSDLSQRLAAHGVPQNLKPLRGLRTRSVSLQVLPSLHPERARDYDGAQLLGGASVEADAVLHPYAQLALSLHRLSIYDADRRVEDDASVLAYQFGVGCRATFANPWWSIGSAAPDALTLGVDMLIPLGSARVMGTFYGDSIDTQHGERILIRDAFPAEVERGWLYHLTYVVSPSERVGILLRASVLDQEIQFIERYRPYYLVSLGVEWRIPF